MFETSKLPTEQRTVTGNPVSFNTHYALPLDACKVSFSATQAGSGDPSPSNPRAISGVSAICLTANSTPVSVSLGDTRYGGYVDMVNKKAIFDVGIVTYNNANNWGFNSYYSGSPLIYSMKSGISSYGGMCNIAKVVDTVSQGGIVIGVNSRRVYLDSVWRQANNINSLEDLNALFNNTPLVVTYPLATPIEIDLSSIPDLSSIIGNNTFSTDTGTLEITFADLQEKSASGSVASFNTALAMPLASCSIAVNAWQEGSGDPYPAGSTAQRWDEETELGSWNDSSEKWQASTTQLKSKNYIPVAPNTTYRLVNPSGTASRYVFYDINKNYLSWATANSNSNFTTPNDTYYMMFGLAIYYGTTYKNDVSINYPATDTSYHSYSNERPIHSFSEVNATRAGKNLFNPNNISLNTYVANDGTLQTNTAWNASAYIPIKGNIQYSFYANDTSGNLPKHAFYDVNKNFISTIEAGNQIFTTPANACFARFSIRTAIVPENVTLVVGQSYLTTPAPYIGNTYTIQLGQDVYGAEVDAVNGVAHVTHGYMEFDGTEGWVDATINGFSCFQIAKGVLPKGAQFISNYIKRVEVMMASEYIGYIDSSNFNVRFTSDTSLILFQKILWDNKMQIAYELDDPFDIQLTPTQIATIQGNNNIFCDTGDTSLTYKDCDLAKRGDFRQVFKIPE